MGKKKRRAIEREIGDLHAATVASWGVTLGMVVEDMLDDGLSPVEAVGTLELAKAEVKAIADSRLQFDDYDF